MAELMRTYDGMGLYAARTDCDKAGNDLTLGIEGTVEFLQDENDELILDEIGNPIADAESDARVVSIGNLPIRGEHLVITFTQVSPDNYTVNTDYATVYAAYNAHVPIFATFKNSATINCPVYPILVRNDYIELQGITYPDEIDNTPSNRSARWVYAFSGYLYPDGHIKVRYVGHQVIPEPDADELQPQYAVWGRRRNQWVNTRAIESVDVAAVSDDVTPVVNNCFNNITGTIPATLTLDCVPLTGEMANFAAQVTAGNSDSQLVVTVNGQPTLYNKAAGDTLEANKTYQISCLNNCWTMSAFEVPT
jgi:hypothetical protein